MGYVSVLALVPGAACVIFGAADAIAHRPGGLVGVIVGLTIIAAAVVTIVSVTRRHQHTADLEWQELRARGDDDGLPLGVFREDERVGLEASDLWHAPAAMISAIGLLLLTIIVITEPPARAPWWFGVLLSLSLFGVAALFVRQATGVAYWLTPEGITRRNKRRHAVHWKDIGQVVPMLHGRPVPRSSPGSADAFALQASEAPSSPARRRGWGTKGFMVNLTRVEVDKYELLTMLRERIRP
jgi:hypothetical protein